MKRKNHELRGFMTGALTMALVFTMASPAGAQMVGKTIEIFTGITIYVDGVEMTPTDANGKPVETFVYNGTTYVPLRAVSQSLGKNVNWDGANQRVYIGEQPGEKQYLLEVCPPYETQDYNTWHRISTYTTESTQTFSMGGNKYTNGFAMDGYGTSDTYANFNLNGQFNSITCTIGLIDGTNKSGGVSFLVDGEVVAQYEIQPSTLPFTVEIPLNYGLHLKICNTDGAGSGTVGVGSIEVY